MQILFEVKVIMPPLPAEPVYNLTGDVVSFKDVLLAEIPCDQGLRKVVDIGALKEKLRVTAQDFLNAT